ncbi:uncharacterized protein LOC134536127 [Bacillus rossius redtenbacheri]|uniref:uncharacterized protein LOC134536127 n=1 Tax=Bacillus rossius redtenbacheri TaxID=93214 RepID=UPI002FDCAFF6
MTATTTLLASATLLAVWAAEAAAHGMLWWPANRGSMWRFGYKTPVNYDDNGLFCGGFSVQWEQNGGRCGECGDDYSLPRPRPNENTGQFGTGVVVARLARGQAFNASVRLTANHLGYFQFKLCPLRGATELETQACFDAHPLPVLGATDYKYHVPSADPGTFSVGLQLPPLVACERCVLQWTYTTGNSWGNCNNGTSRLGCGSQETFRTCSDISVL